MKSPSRPGLIPARFLLVASSLLICRFAVADTVVHLGSISQLKTSRDLDLAGEMTYAINFSANDPVLTVNGVAFTPDGTPPGGATFVGPNAVTPWETKPDFGSGTDDNTLEQIFEDIRWANTGAGQTLEANLPVTAGERYKLQVLFSGNHPEDRKWDIEVEGNLAVDEVTSLGANVGGVNPDYSQKIAVVYSTILTSADTTLNVRFVGDLPGSNNDGAIDRNPIWQALTVEHVVGDSDGDEMTDAWETLYFTNLSRDGTADFDSDGLSDLKEFLRDAKPNDSDTDDDGLTDGAEVNTHSSDPKSADSDGDGLTDPNEINTHNSDPNHNDSDRDGLTDSAEINTHLTDPTKVDTDGDEYDDAFEVAQGSNPTNPASFPLFSPQAKSISGGDPGEGLDLTGNFLAAVRFGMPGQVGPWPVRDAEFVPYDSFPGLIETATTDVDNWLLPSFATAPTATQDDINLGEVVDSISYGPSQVNISIPGLTVGRAYKVQLLFGEQCCNNRGFDVYLEDVLVADEFATGPVQGGASGAPARVGAVVAAFIATDTTLNARLDFTTITSPGLTDSNAIINAMTVEELPALPDTDTDGLPDIWEITNFGNTSSQSGTSDADADGLNNLGEFQAVTDPNDPDSDNDGLNDGPEVNTHQTDPRRADTDGDGLSDPAEINTHLTNPRDPDSDNDEYSDAFEVSRGSNPNSATSQPLFAPQSKGISGGDVGEGLDLDGTFIAAVRFGVFGQVGSWPVRDATFVPFDTFAGLTQDAINEADNWLLPTYATAAGATTNDINLGEVVDSIRYGMPMVNVSVPGLTVGRAYKVQVLFGEQCCNNRGFDVYLEDLQVADEFITGPAQGGASAAPARTGAVVAVIVATDNTLDLRLDFTTITTAGIIDSNNIINALTIEELPPIPDTDGDGLGDAWELENFGDLNQNAAGDADSDGLTNRAEYLRGLKPTDADGDDDGLNDGGELTRDADPWNPDTDGDGLTDGAEVNTHASNPKSLDSDRDTLPDAAEVGTHLTKPGSIDSDNDGFNDPTELLNTTDPNSAASTPGVSHIVRVLGGDSQAEGLDLDGTFLYAFNVGTPGAAGQVRDATFTDDLQPGITWSATNEIALWQQPNFGNTQNDDNLEFVFQSIRWEAAPLTLTVDLDGLTVGAQYKLQLLFGEGCCANRGFDLNVEGATVIDNFSTADAQLAQSHPYASGGMVHSFTATDSTLNIELNGNTTGFGDKNPILSGVTLEALSATQPFAITNIVRTPTGGGATIVLTFTGRGGKVYSVDFTTDLAVWNEISDAATAGAGGTGTYTDTLPARTNGVKGHYRLRDPVLQPNP